MKLTEHNLEDIAYGDVFYMPQSFKTPKRFTLVYVMDDYYTFASESEVLRIYAKNFNFNNSVRVNGLYTTYEECCEAMRELCLHTIEHFNNQQLHNNPILIKN